MHDVILPVSHVSQADLDYLLVHSKYYVWYFGLGRRYEAGICTIVISMSGAFHCQLNFAPKSCANFGLIDMPKWVENPGLACEHTCSYSVHVAAHISHHHPSHCPPPPPSPSPSPPSPLPLSLFLPFSPSPLPLPPPPTPPSPSPSPFSLSLPLSLRPPPHTTGICRALQRDAGPVVGNHTSQCCWFPWLQHWQTAPAADTH